MTVSHSDVSRARDEVDRFKRDLSHNETRERELRSELSRVTGDLMRLRTELPNAERKLRDLEIRQREEEREKRNER